MYETLIALRNGRNRFFIPSKDNSFGGFIVKYVMIDTGCNTTLLPIKKGEFPKILNLFPNTNYDWRITRGGGVAALQSPVLNIEHINKEKIIIELSKDVNLFKTSVTSLRFHLSYEDTIDLIKYNENNKFIIGIHLLESFKNIVENIKNIDNKIKIGERRNHALLGQSVIGIDSFFIFQITNITIISSNKDQLNTLINNRLKINEIEDKCILWVDKSFDHGMSEFKDLEDDDHDEDYLISLNINNALDE